MFNPYFIGAFVLLAFGVGFVYVFVDAIIPVVIGTAFRRDRRWLRYLLMLGLPIFLLFIVTLAATFSLLPISVLPQGSEWVIVVTAVGASYYLGISSASLLLRDAPDVVRTIIESLFPRGGPIPYGAEDVGAAEKVLSFLDQLGGPNRDLLYVLATGINSPLTSWILLATFRRFTELSTEERQLFLLNWMNHENLIFRSLSHLFKALACLGYYSDPRVWKEIGYPGPLVPQYTDSVEHDHEVPNHTHLAGPTPHPVETRPRVDPEEPEPEVYGVTPFVRRRRRYKVVDRDLHERADVCIVGSGAAGALLAYELCLNPEIKSVVVLERGGYFEGEDFNQRELDMLRLLWKGGAQTFNRDYTIFVGQGETLGGTTVINHAICIDTPQVVLEEWRKLGAGEWMTDSAEVTRCLEEIKGQINVKPVDERHWNRNNSILREGAEALGIGPDGHGPNPRNCIDCSECGFSHLGCHYDAKQSTLVTFVPQALDTGKCRVFCDAWAERITFDRLGATGVEAVFMTRKGEKRHRLRIDSKVVVVAAGAINSTALLLRSKVPDPQKQVGKGLSLHPSPLVIAEFDEEVRAFEGIPMSYNVSEYSVLRGVPGVIERDLPEVGDAGDESRGGFMLEAVFPNLGQFAAFLPGMGEEHKGLMSRLNHYAAAGILIRDTPNGRVGINSSGDPVVVYGLDQQDRRNLSDGIRKLVELYFAAGAKRVIVTHRDTTVIDANQYQKDPEVVERLIYPDNCGQDLLYLGAVHPQGGNRLGTDPKTSVVDEHCIHHRVRNLVVCDASVFPTATGVNPMLPIMAVAKRTAEYINQSWKPLVQGLRPS